MFDRRRRQWLAGFWLLTLGWLATPGCQRTPLDVEIDGLKGQCRTEAENLVAAQRELWASESTLKALEAETKQLEAAANRVSQHAASDDSAEARRSRWEDARPTAVRALSDGLEARRKALVSYAGVLSGEKTLESRASDLVREAAQEVADSPTRVREHEAKYGVRVAELDRLSQPLWRGVWPYLVSRDCLLVWLVGLACTLILWGVIRHDFRRAIRQQHHAVSNQLFVYMRGRPRDVSQAAIGANRRKRTGDPETPAGASDSLDPRTPATEKASPGAPVGSLRRRILAVGVFLRWLWIHRIVAVAMGAVVLVLASCWPLRPSLTEAKGRERDGLKRQLKELQDGKTAAAEKKASLDATVASKKAANDKTFSERLTPEFQTLVATAAASDEKTKSAAAQVVADAVAMEVGALGQLRELSGYVGIADQAGTEVNGYVRKMGEQNQSLERLSEVSHTHAFRLLQVKGALLSFFLLLNVGLVVGWGVRKRRDRRPMAEVCPRCLAERTLTPSTDAHGKPTANCSSCKYTMDESHRGVWRVCYPTAGFGGSGKTVWLAMFRHQVKHVRANSSHATFGIAHSPGTADADIDKVLEALIRFRHKPEATKIEGEKKESIPAPLLYHFCDGDRSFPSSGLLNQFDFAGAMTAPDMKGTEVQQRALLMDGFLYFIDPTKEDKFDEQREQLASFCEEVRKARNIQFGDPLEIPFAICITKLDILADPGYPGATRYEQFFQQLNPAEGQRPPTRHTLRRRHRVFARHRETFFPGWDLGEQVRTLVGGRYLFFPMSSAGISAESGVDPKDWNFQPFGIVEPILWLLHMNGFQTLMLR